MLFGVGTRQLKRPPRVNGANQNKAQGQRPGKRPKKIKKHRLKFPKLKILKFPKGRVRTRPRRPKSTKQPNYVILLTDPVEPPASSGSKYQPPPATTTSSPAAPQYSTTTTPASTTTAKTATKTIDSYGAPKGEPEALPVYQDPPSPTVPSGSLLQPEPSSFQPSYVKFEPPFSLPTFYSPPDPTSYTAAAAAAYKSTGATYVAPFQEPELTPQASQKPTYPKASAKPLVDSYGSPVKYPESVQDYKPGDAYSAPKARRQSPKNSGSAAFDSYGAPKPASSYSPPTTTTTANIDSYGAPNYSPLDSYDSYGSPKANPVSSQYSSPANIDSLDSYGAPKAEPVKANQNIDSYGAPIAEPIQSYSPPPNSGYSAPTTTPCPEKDHASTSSSSYKAASSDISGFPNPKFPKPDFKFTSGFEPGW